MRKHARLMSTLLLAASCTAVADADEPVRTAPRDSAAADSTATLADSIAAPAAPPDTLQMDIGLELDVARLDSTLQSLESAGERLDATNRRILREMVAGARELYDQGDLEAASILVDDVQLFLRQRSR